MVKQFRKKPTKVKDPSLLSEEVLKLEKVQLKGRKALFVKAFKAVHLDGVCDVQVLFSYDLDDFRARLQQVRHKPKRIGLIPL